MENIITRVNKIVKNLEQLILELTKMIVVTQRTSDETLAIRSPFFLFRKKVYRKWNDFLI